jgi:hypothetical protein
MLWIGVAKHVYENTDDTLWNVNIDVLLAYEMLIIYILYFLFNY